jgi:ATP-dependent helicase HepA
MNHFIAGQRWISSTEAELGLGLVLDVLEHRVTVLFLATGERRVYAINNSPLIRVQFAVGDEIESTDNQKLIVQLITTDEGLMTYQGLDKQKNIVYLPEIDLNHHLQFNKPQERLFTGKTDPSAWFLLRYQTWQHIQNQQQSPIRGLQGGRTSLIAHQLFIAQQVANRFSPKIMLADEVGLGKTIEAGLILHSRLLNGLSQRALIIVPEALLHQWLVEMLRRFNLRFSLFNEARCEAMEFENPFSSEQLVLAGQQFFTHNPNRQQQALAAGWDMLIVDEAHHLEWNKDQPSDDYLFVEQLSLQTQAVILLTATPEQLGKESHFARLRLLDPDRFYNFEAFLAEEQQFEPVAKIANALFVNQPLDEYAKENLQALIKHDEVESLVQALDHPEKATQTRQQLLEILLDYHGTGRILFRNSRQTVKGFPERQAFAYPLTTPKKDWLITQLERLHPEQLVLICHLASTVITLEKHLKHQGFRVAIFHENMSLIERDRAAAYFADPDNAAQILLCSEIGSEGRNFQFAHHLVLFDLPENPDLLQQRIGRLDRIGQKSTIQIHVPYQQNSAEAVLYRWYAEGFNAFCHNCSAAQTVAEQLKIELKQVMSSQDSVLIDGFILKTQTLTQKIEHTLQQGRDQLLELNSCRPKPAQQLIECLESQKNQPLWAYSEALFECYGVNSEEHSKDCYILNPSENLRLSHFPHLPDEGLTITVNRDIALIREDMAFLTFEHPMITAAMDLVISSDTGNASMSLIQHPDLTGGQFLLECLFIVECVAPIDLQIGRFLPPSPIRILIDQNQDDKTHEFSHEALIESDARLNEEKMGLFLSQQRPLIQKILAVAEHHATLEMQHLITERTQVMNQHLTYEINRLIRLQKINPSIKPLEIEQLKETACVLKKAVQTAQLKLDAVRFIVTKDY